MDAPAAGICPVTVPPSPTVRRVRLFFWRAEVASARFSPDRLGTSTSALAV